MQIDEQLVLNISAILLSISEPVLFPLNEYYHYYTCWDETIKWILSLLHLLRRNH